MKKILQITNYMFPNYGGIEQVTRDIARSLSPDKDIKQKIICFNSNAAADEYICHQNETVHDYIDGVEVIRCKCFAKFASQQLSFSFGHELNKIMTEFKPDIVIFHYPNPLEAFFLLKHTKKTFKLVVFWHLDITKQKLLGKLFHGQSLALLKRADRVIPASPNYIEGSPYLSRFKEKCTVIPDCITSDKIQINEQIKATAQQIKHMYNGKTICLAVGRHVPYKGFKYLIDAAKQLDDRFVICIAGSGPLTSELKVQAQGCEHIKFLGRISEEELKAYYIACDIFCFSSITKNEAFGLALAEAMYFGKPSVTFNIIGSGVNFVSLNGVTGIECPNSDYNAYASAIKKLAEDDTLRKKLGNNAHKRAEELFMFKQFSNNIENLIRML